MRQIQENAVLSNSCLANDFSLDIAVHYPGTEKKSYQKILNERIGIRDENDTFMFIYGGTLTITFGGNGSLLKSIDAYTNQSNWILQAVEIPPSVTSGLSLVESCDSSDRFSIEFDPSYFFDSKKRALKVVLVHPKQEKLLSIGDSLIVGISDGLVSSLIIKDLVIK
jgi:hypothetical protein